MQREWTDGAAASADGAWDGLLKDGIKIIITAAEGESACETCGVMLLTASGGRAVMAQSIRKNPKKPNLRRGDFFGWGDRRAGRCKGCGKTGRPGGRPLRTVYR